MQLMTDNSTKTLINLTKQIYNGLTQAIEDGDTKEAAERLRQDDVISAKVTAETDARIQADSDEATTRQAKDAELQTAIETEATERKGADTSLQSNIDKEATTRASADTAINTKLDPIKTLTDIFYMSTPVKAYDSWAGAQPMHKPVWFGAITISDVGGEASQIGGMDKWSEIAVKKLYQKIKNQGYTGVVQTFGNFYPAVCQPVYGMIWVSSNGKDFEDASGCPLYCQFISLTYGGDIMYRFGTKNGTWYFETIPTTKQVNTLISNAKTALETAYKNADTQLQTDITTAYQQADTNLSNTLTQAYTDADTALKTELETKINNMGGSGIYLRKAKILETNTATFSTITINSNGTISNGTESFTGPGTSDSTGWYAYLICDQKQILDGWLCTPFNNQNYMWKMYECPDPILASEKRLAFYRPNDLRLNGAITFLVGSPTNYNVEISFIL